LLLPSSPPDTRKRLANSSIKATADLAFWEGTQPEGKPKAAIAYAIVGGD
jgi:hypothetical protein